MRLGDECLVMYNVSLGDECLVMYDVRFGDECLVMYGEFRRRMFGDVRMRLEEECLVMYNVSLGDIVRLEVVLGDILLGDV